VKPVDNAGSRGVSRIDKVEDIKEAYLSAKDFSRVGDLLIEEFMDGQEVAVDAFIYKKDMYVLTVSDKIRTDPPYLLDTTVIFPSSYPDDIINEVCKIAMKASVYAVGIDNSPIHVEIMVTREGPKMVELAARGAGFKVYSDILPMITGVDTLNAAIKMCLDMGPDFSVKKKRAAVLKFFPNKLGKLKAIKGLDAVKNLKGVVDLELYIKLGDIIKPLTCGSDRIGHVISLADTRKDALALVEQVEELIDFEVENT
jgi:biotin carboxylase